MAKGRKISVVGAGAVGTAVAYAALIRQVANEIALYDINTPKVEAEAADLAHGSHFTGWPHVSGSSDIAVTSGSDIVVITAGAKQNPGQSRLELVRDNARILKAMIPKLVEASPDAIFILVTNPCDVLTMVAQRISGLPTSRVISSGTVLDSSRLRRLIADRARISTASVHASIIGEHGDSEFPMWSVARIGAVPIADYRVNGHQVFPPDVLDDLAHQVMTSAYKVIAGKGATNFAIGLSASRICEAILRDEHSVQPVSSILHGQYGIEGVALSLPSVLGAGGVEQVLDTPLSEDEKGRRHPEQLQAGREGNLRNVMLQRRSPPGAALTETAGAPVFRGFFHAASQTDPLPAVGRCPPVLRALQAHRRRAHSHPAHPERKAPGQVSLPPGLFRGSRHGLLSPGRSGSLRDINARPGSP